MTIRVLSYNIHKGFSTTNINFTLPMIREQIHALNPDIALVQEVVGENLNYLKKIKDWPAIPQHEYLAQGLYEHSLYGKNALFPIRHHGNAILSHFPIVQWENINISNNKLEQRGLLHATLKLPNGKHLHIFNVHLDLTEKGRNNQFKKIIARAESHVPEDAPFLIGGDFNDWRQSATPMFREFLGVHESFHHFHGSHASSFPSFGPFLRLDRLYVRKINVTNAACLTEKPWPALSDHLPLWLEIEIED